VSYPYASLPENLAAFCAMLRHDYHFRAGPRELRDAVHALAFVELADEHAVRNVLRPVLAGRLEDVRVFDLAFDRFFGLGPGAPPRIALPSPESPVARDRPSGAGASSGAAAHAEEEDHETVSELDAENLVHADTDADVTERAKLLRSSYSSLRAEGAAATLEPPARAWRDAADLLVNRLHAGLSRRWRPSPRGRRFDLRRTLRTSFPTAGEVVIPRWRARPRRRPRLVVLVDGSRSMESSVAPSLQMAVALAGASLDTEVFTFSTALRRITRDVRRAAGGERRHVALEDAWGGGTTIGVCLREFLQRYGERLLGRDTVIIIASDGLDIGDISILRDAMARLSRLSAAVIWLNPHLRTPGFAPTALGMSVARPFVTTLGVVREPADLVQLAREVRVR
jgi:uncharacterized protein with von Willebrand factor type A (vWA) domain